MWNVENETTASIETERRSWRVDLAGGESGIRIGDENDESVAFLPVNNDKLPPISESYIRGDQLHAIYPQQDNSYSLHLVLKPIEKSATRLVLEATVSIETLLLDSHPTLDIVAIGDGFNCVTPSNSSVPASGDAMAGCAGITSVARGKFFGGVVLGDKDFPATLDLSDDEEIRLRLFGEFLEKGVIRKARPWIVIDRSGASPSDSEMTDLWQRLNDSPLPLMS